MWNPQISQVMFLFLIMIIIIRNHWQAQGKRAEEKGSLHSEQGNGKWHFTKTLLHLGSPLLQKAQALWPCRAFAECPVWTGG